MDVRRRIARTTSAPLEPGFLGPGHLAAERVESRNFVANDPFILLMDDNLQLGDRPAQIGGAHPHAGFETVTFILKGSLRDRYEGGLLQEGDVQWMTAGRGIIHSENIEARGNVRILQLWLTLPKRERWTTPGFHNIRLDTVPVRNEPGVEVRLYSGSSGGLRSSTPNHVPVTLADIRLAAGASLEQDLPASYNGFFVAIDGAARIGEDATPILRDQVGWLDRVQGDGRSLVRVTAGAEGARLILYAGQPQEVPIVSYGPFIGDTREDIARLAREYNAGQFKKMSELERERSQQSA